jgi:anaerobic selenocysteine-containing dehydrogenase
MIHSGDAAEQGMSDGDLAMLGNVRGRVRLHAVV